MSQMIFRVDGSTNRCNWMDEWDGWICIIFTHKATTITDYWLNVPLLQDYHPFLNYTIKKTIYQVRQASLSATSVISSLRGWCQADLSLKMDGWMDGWKEG